ncbi:GGDEF domain-containing protein [Enterovirga sp. CN4-39]|uniref:GGDEF domain-containing protein n=1 Tax=Enterovirga sp. CN4-39 TaxID=3400910 RepID=UPI003C01F00C
MQYGTGLPLERDAGPARLYMQAARMAGIGGWECDLATGRLTWTEEVHRLFEHPVEACPQRAAILSLYTDESRDEMEFLRARTIATGCSFTLDARIRTTRGEPRWMRLSAGIEHRDGRPVRLFGAKQDITREKEAWARLRGLADYDPLTGLLNRRVFDTRYRQVVADEIRHGDVAALALIDLDNFKQINDRYGHAAGDECLRQVAERLRKNLPDADTLARIGGDEFAVLLRAPLEPARTRSVLERARNALREPILWNRHLVDLTVSIGAAPIGRPHLRRLSGLFAEADEALYAAKSAGRNGVRLFGDPAEPGKAALQVTWSGPALRPSRTRRASSARGGK